MFIFRQIAFYYFLYFLFQNANLEELSRVIFSSLEEGIRLKILKQSNIPLKDVISLYDEKIVIEHTIEKVGVSKLLEHLQSIENTGSFTQEIAHFCSNKVALNEIVKKHSVDDLRQALTDLIDKKTFDKNDVIQNCLIPLVETPKDIQPYLKSLSLVDLGDIVIERLPEDDYDQFLTKLSKVCLNGAKETLTVQLCKKDLQSPEDFVSFFGSCLSAKNEEEQTEIKVELFRFISGSLSVEMLASLHVEFLHRISNNFSIKDK